MDASFNRNHNKHKNTCRKISEKSENITGGLFQQYCDVLSVWACLCVFLIFCGFDMFFWVGGETGDCAELSSVASGNIWDCYGMSEMVFCSASLLGSTRGPHPDGEMVWCTWCLKHKSGDWLGHDGQNVGMCTQKGDSGCSTCYMNVWEQLDNSMIWCGIDILFLPCSVGENMVF